MNPFVVKNVLAATDLSESSIPALKYARILADRFGAKLTIMYTDPIVYPVDFAGPTEMFFLPAGPEHEATLQAEVRQHADEILRGRSYDIHVSMGQPVPAILAAARDLKADCIVIGTHLRHGWRRALLGSVSDGVLHGSHCPVLTVASHDQFGVKIPYSVTKIVCPVNFTDVSRDALRVATSVAETFGAQLTIVHVLESDEVMNTAADEQRVREWLEPEVQGRCSYRELIVRGGPAERVLDCADDVSADLLVVGAQHKLFRDSTVVGTTTERLIRFAACPVMVVPREAVPHHAKEVEEARVPAGAGV